jgi:para-aminobenzoate synthetase component 1
VLSWAKQFNTFCFLDNHQYKQGPHSQECILGAGIKRLINSETAKSFNKIQQIIEEKNSWLFGHLSYDLKKDFDFAHSNKEDRIGFSNLMFFEPETLIQFNESTIEISATDPQLIMNQIQRSGVESDLPTVAARTKLINRISRDEYIETIKKLKEHILRGDCYEINFCQEIFCLTEKLNPLSTYQRLASISPNPFSALYRHNESWLICASPERFLKRTKDHILSQPIKGTSKRFINDEKDLESRTGLSESQKDRSENVMVVDLVRNDLSRICKEGTVVVDELFGIYSFPQVHQMISTISGELKADISFGDIIRATFPMGSMTGAPKKRVIELIEKYEVSRRGIFSGALGYISPNGDFDFNVVIRSLLYNASDGYLSYQVGSGITFYSDPEQEWEECLMKAEAMEKVLYS